MATPDTGHLGDRLSALLDGELTSDEVVAARAHLAGCATCAIELEAADSARSLLPSARMTAPSSSPSTACWESTSTCWWSRPPREDRTLPRVRRGP